MSLINDALKRAGEVQPPPLPPHQHPPLRPAELPQAAVRGMGLVVPAALAILALMGLFLVWQIRNREAPEDRVVTVAAEPVLEARARTVETAVVAPVAPTSPAAPRPASAEKLPVTPELPVVSATPTNAAAVQAPLAPALRLQGIVVNPRRPSALINGRTLFVGERIGPSMVVAISPTTVTLVTSGVTNILELTN